jgi:hypothetical protein
MRRLRGGVGRAPRGVRARARESRLRAGWAFSCEVAPAISRILHVPLQEERLRNHVKILGWLYIVLGALNLLIGLALFGFLSGIGVLSGDIQAFGVMTLIGGFTGVIMLVVALPNLVCGLGLLRDWGGWVVVLAVILGLFNLATFPVGTAIALYTFWVAWKLYSAPGE